MMPSRSTNGMMKCCDASSLRVLTVGAYGDCRFVSERVWWDGWLRPDARSSMATLRLNRGTHMEVRALRFNRASQYLSLMLVTEALVCWLYIVASETPLARK